MISNYDALITCVYTKCLPRVEVTSYGISSTSDRYHIKKKETHSGIYVGRSL